MSETEPIFVEVDPSVIDEDLFCYESVRAVILDLRRQMPGNYIPFLPLHSLGKNEPA